jgi:hypothetical protein
MLRAHEEAGDGDDGVAKSRCHSTTGCENNLLHSSQLLSGTIVPAKRQISWGCVATSNDDLSLLNNGPRVNHSNLPYIDNTAPDVSTVDM